MSARVVAVALPLPFQSPFSYRLPDGVPFPERGARVLVPFGRRRVVGVSMGAGTVPARGELKDVLEVVDEEPLVLPPLLDLAAWAADYYLAPPGECYRLAFPPEGMAASRAVARLTGDPSAHAADDVVRLLAEGPVRLSTLARRLGRDPSARLTRLRKAGVVVVEQEMDRLSFTETRIARLVQPDAEVKGKAQQQLMARLR